MALKASTSREFWHGVLAAGSGFTPLPRWTRVPVAGVAEYETPVPAARRQYCADWQTTWQCR